MTVAFLNKSWRSWDALGGGTYPFKLVVTRSSKEEVRTVNSKSGGTLRVCDAVLADDTGEIGMSLWQDDVDNVKVDDTIEIIDGYLTEFREQKKLGKGKFGRMLINPTD